MSFILAIQLGIADELPGWTAVGPERGHVMDVGLRNEQIVALSRIGALAAPMDLSEWARDPHFPVNARAFSFVPDSGEAWSITPNAIFYGAPHPLGIAPAPAGGMLLDIEASESDAALVLVRGSEAAAGVWRIGRDRSFVQSLSGVDPWTLAVRNNFVYLGTLGQGLWVSKDFGKSFSNVIPEGTVSAVRWIDESPWFGWVDGRITKDESQTLQCTLPKATPTSIARVGGQIYAYADEKARPYFDIFRCEPDGTATPVRPEVPDPDQFLFAPTGLWPIDADRALVGTFRAGPFLLDATGLTPARTGFRATLGSAAAARDGEVAVAMMSTGVYHTIDEGKTWAIPGLKGRSFPVTDTADLLFRGNALIALDFEGLRILSDNTWTGEAGKKVQNTLRSNDLMDLTFDADNQLWAKDFQGGLWTQSGGDWQACPAPKVVRLDGQGADFVVVTQSAFLSIKTCEGPLEPAWQGEAGKATPATARADAGWLAAPGALYFHGRPIAALARARIEAIAAHSTASGKPFVLVAQERSPVLRCDQSACEAVAKAPPSPIRALGQLGKDGIWALELRGTVVVARAGEAGSDIPAPAQSIVVPDLPLIEQAELSQQTALLNLEHPPWRGAVSGVDPQSPHKGSHAIPSDADIEAGTPSFWRWIVLAEFVVLVAAIAYFARKRPTKPRPRSRN